MAGFYGRFLWRVSTAGFYGRFLWPLDACMGFLFRELMSSSKNGHDVKDTLGFF